MKYILKIFSLSFVILSTKCGSQQVSIETHYIGQTVEDTAIQKIDFVYVLGTQDLKKALPSILNYLDTCTFDTTYKSHWFEFYRYKEGMPFEPGDGENYIVSKYYNYALLSAYYFYAVDHGGFFRLSVLKDGEYVVIEWPFQQYKADTNRVRHLYDEVLKVLNGK